MSETKKKPGRPKKEDMQMEDGIYFDAYGTYYYHEGVNKIFKPYRLQGLKYSNNPNLTVPNTKILQKAGIRGTKGIVHQEIIKRYKEFPNFFGVRECSIENVVYVGRTVKDESNMDTSIDRMSLDQLESFVIREDLKTNVLHFDSIKDARNAVEDEYENRKMKQRKLLAKERGEDFKIDEQIFDEMVGVN